MDVIADWKDISEAWSNTSDTEIYKEWTDFKQAYSKSMPYLSTFGFFQAIDNLVTVYNFAQKWNDFNEELLAIAPETQEKLFMDIYNFLPYGVNAVFKTWYSSSLHSDIDVTETLLMHLNPLDFRKEIYIPKTSGSASLPETATENIKLIGGISVNNRIINNTVDKVLIEGGNKSNIIENYASSDVTLKGGIEYNVFVNLRGDKASIYAKGERNLVQNISSDDVIIETADGVNTVNNFHSFRSTITAGNGDDYIENFGDLNTINAGEDYILNIGDNNLVDAGSDNDYIINIGNDNTIASGAGDDIIDLQYGTDNVINYTKGNDYVYGFKRGCNRYGR